MKIKRANIKDLNFFYDCRNNILTRKMMMNTKFIKLKKHREWFLSAIKSNRQFLYVGSNKERFGVVNFSIDKLSYNSDVSITIHPEYRKKNLSHLLLKGAINKFKKQIRKNINLIAKIKKNNKASIKCFLKVGFKFLRQSKNILYFKISGLSNNPIKKNKNIIAIVQARQTSTRLPNKVLKKICDAYLLKILLARLSRSKKINEIVLAIPNNQKNSKLYKEALKWNQIIYKGDENNVLKRYYQTAKYYKADIILRITGDCPLIDPILVDNLVDFFKKRKIDYASNNLVSTFPHGLDMEIFNFSALKNSYLNATKNYQKEHVTYYITENKKFKKANLASNVDYSNERWTVDEKEDLYLIRKIFENYYPNIYFSWKQVVKYMKKNKKLYFINNHLKKNVIN